MVNVIIIGAGAAGLAAASRLVEKGLNPTEITILEAENRIGGRIHTVQHGILSITSLISLFKFILFFKFSRFKYN